MQCPSCERDNRDGALFCAGCGGALPRCCASCGRELPRDAAFCDGCGAATDVASAPAGGVAARARDPRAYTPRHLAERILTSRGALEGERKHVTVLFADLAGFTRLSEERDPEEMHALMDRFFQLLLEQVHRYEGTVNQFLGDGAMALFGAPVALEDAPRRAVKAGLGIQRRLVELSEERGVPLPLRIGIHSGLVVVGRIGDDLRMDYTAVGDTTNLAARLQQIAPPGEILISASTRRGVEGFFELEDAGLHELRGKTEPVRAWRVGAERAVSGRIDAVADSGLTPLVGRERELAALRAAFEAARGGRGQACFLVGDAGIGKSRLLYEFREQVETEPHTWIEGRCASYGRTTAFQAVVDGLQRCFGIDDRDDDGSALDKLERGVGAVGADLAWTLPFFQKLLSLPVSDPKVAALEAVTRRSETLRALHAFFLATAEQRPLVCVFEDLHWIDPASEEFLEFLIESIPAAQVCLLLTHRPGYRHPFGDRSYHVRVGLQSLSAGEMTSMAGSLLASQELPAELRELIVQKAEGNPFFVEEVTRSLLEEGVLALRDGRVKLARKLSEVSVPDRIQDVLMARIDRLDEEPKRAIQMASVIGREFAMRLLERIVEAGDAVHSVVGELRSLELIYQKAAHPELAFMFKHALTHDVAYESVLKERRKTLHRVVGSAIEELYADRLAEHYEALAHHFEQAEDFARALRYYRDAAGKARDAYANHSAAEHYQRALAMAERLGDVDPEERRALAEGLGHVSACVNEFRASGDAYRQAAEWSGDRIARSRNFSRASHSYHWGHFYDEAVAAREQGLEAAGGDESAELLALIQRAHHTATSQGIAGLGDPRTLGESLFERAMATGDDETLSSALINVGLWAEMTGRYRRAIEIFEIAEPASARADQPANAIWAVWGVGLSLTCLGEYGRAIEHIRNALDFSQRIGDRALRSRLLNTLGWCHAEFGCHREAAEFNRQGAAIAGELVDLGLVAAAPEIHSNAAINLAGNRVALGDPDGAGELLEPIWRSLGEPGDPWQRWRYGMHVRDALARVALSRGEPERALEFVDEELQAARDHRSRKLEARALELRGRALLHMDDREAAARCLAEALDVAREIAYPPVVWRALALRAELARRGGDAGAAEREAAEGRALVERLAAALPRTELRREFSALGERLAREPLAALR